MSKKASKKKKIESDEETDNDNGEFVNSEDEYISPLEESEEESEDEQAGGATDNEDTADEHLDVDPDEEKADYNEDDSEEYDPVEHEELADEDAEIENEDDAENEEAEEEYEGEEVPAEAGEMEGEEGTAPAKVCHVKNLNKEIIMDEDDSGQYAKLDYVRIPDDERMTDSIMSYYELVRVLGTRAQQFNFGAIPLVEGLEGLHPAKKAYVELIAKMTPFIIRRHLPGKRYEEWRIDELEQIHLVDDEFFVPDNLDLSKILDKKKK